MARADLRVRLDGIPPHVWIVGALLFLCLVYAVAEVGFVRSRLPADHPAARLPGVLLTRPPALDAASDEASQLEAWRRSYWQGALLSASPGGLESTARAGDRRAWGPHAGRILQVVSFISAAITLFVVRSSDLTAALAALALAFSGVAAGGPLYGVEDAVPGGRGMTLFTWIAGPLAFPTIALAILYFPEASPRLSRYPALHVVPFVAAAPMIATGVMTSLYLTGVDAALDAALWDARHPGAFYASVAAALSINVLAVAEGLHRYRFNHDANSRRRFRMAVYTCVPGILAYALKDGVPIVTHLGGGAPVFWPPAIEGLLQVLLLLPAIGLVYVVGVARVLGPRMVLRRSLQYTLATRTLTLLTMLPAIALVSLLRDPDARIRDVLTSVYLALLAISITAFVHRERARQWLDERFFREEYDARKILLSLSSRVRFETDPSDLANLVVQQVDQALHPERVAILGAGRDDARLGVVAGTGEPIDPLPIDSGLASMLRWSEEPLEIVLTDGRSPLRRLPPEEQTWLERTRAALLVPVHGEKGSLVAVIVLGEKRSEEAYTGEDRALLASIAAQMGLGFDVARLRRRLDGEARAGSAAGEHTTRLAPARDYLIAECPRCGRCEEPSVAVCPSDGATMLMTSVVPRELDQKYRLEQLLGRGGMGAVYRARDMRLDRLVAVKVVRADLVGNPDARRRFRREAQIVAQLQHPAIVSVFDYGTLDGGAAYLVMELVRGEDLRRVLVREGRFEPQRAVRILVTVCGAIETAHRQGVLHRDLKPENILLPPGDITAKVLDFGVAKVIAPERHAPGTAPAEAPTVLTVDGAIVGTPAYMAPEQLRGHTPDARTDVFSLGVIAYEMLTGDLPFGRASLAEVVLAQVRGVPPDGLHALPPPLTRAVRAALELDPDRRLPSPQAFAHLLGAAEGL